MSFGDFIKKAAEGAKGCIEETTEKISELREQTESLNNEQLCRFIQRGSYSAMVGMSVLKDRLSGFPN